jgi:SepF-like predicted cell division protein (DUF552 family)
MKFFSIKKKQESDDDVMMDDNEYVEINTQEGPASHKVIVRPFVMNEFGDIKPILNSLREGYTIALVNIRPLKDKDLVELKRAINKLKKTCDAINGDIAGFGDDYIVITPSFASIHRSKDTNPVQATGGDDEDM